MRNHIVLTSLVFIVVGLLHALRAWYGLSLEVGGYSVSITTSWVVALLTLSLALLGIVRIKKS